MHVDRGWLKEVITLGQFILKGSAVADESSVSNQHQGDKVHRTVGRLLFVTRATGAARDEVPRKVPVMEGQCEVERQRQRRHRKGGVVNLSTRLGANTRARGGETGHHLWVGQARRLRLVKLSQIEV